ncbi:uncharacterized protein Dsimw501_GD27021, isoform A [Drosophila simulans]|nr:uncharacterized protein Dsimw501_GD27021, isoform A [Drosophila simulans]
MGVQKGSCGPLCTWNTWGVESKGTQDVRAIHSPPDRFGFGDCERAEKAQESAEMEMAGARGATDSRGQ